MSALGHVVSQLMVPPVYNTPTLPIYILLGVLKYLYFFYFYLVRMIAHSRGSVGAYIGLMPAYTIHSVLPSTYAIHISLQQLTSASIIDYSARISGGCCRRLRPSSDLVVSP